MPGFHSLFAPSAAVRWMRCHAALAACKSLPPEPENIDAALGTAKHKISEVCLSDNVEPEKYRGDVLQVGEFKFTVDEEFISHVHAYIDAIRREPGEKYYEVRVDTSPILGIPEQGGTADTIILKFDTDTLEVHDAKFGYKKVIAKWNEQLLNYAAAALREYDLAHDWRKVRVVIHQPTLDHMDEHTYTRAEVEDFGRIAHDAAQASYALYKSGTAEQIRGAMNPGTAQCTYCPLRGQCPARSGAILEMFRKEGDDDRIISVELDDAVLADALTRVEEIESWCADVRAEAAKRALAGKHLPGFKLIRGRRSNRFWSDMAGALLKLPQLLGDKAFEPRKLISPTEAEKSLNGDQYESIAVFVKQNPGQLKLVPENAKGEAVTVQPTDFKEQVDVSDLI